MSEPDLPSAYFEYLVAAERRRAENVQQAIDMLTPFERRLLREAAVMGYVRGRMWGRDEELPRDFVMIRDVIDACIAHDDKFPLLAALARGKRLEVDEVGGHIPGGPE